MGIIAPRNAGSDAPGGKRRKGGALDPIAGDVVLTTPAEPPPPGGPDASMLKPADFPARAMPPLATGARDGRYQVVFRQSVLDEIHAHGKSSPDAEVCGVLIGDVYSDGPAPWAYVQACIRGNGAVGSQTQVTITSDTWSRIHQTLESDFPGRQIVGWYHTHPGFGIFLSGMDLFIQDNFFNQPWQVAFVYDPIGGDEGTFIWREGKSHREPHLIEDDASRATLAGTGGAASVPADALEVLTRRVQSLERRLDIILTGFLFLILLALVVPLVVFFVGPEALGLDHLRHAPPPAAPSQPAPAPTTAPSVPATIPAVIGPSTAPAQPAANPPTTFTPVTKPSVPPAPAVTTRRAESPGQPDGANPRPTLLKTAPPGGSDAPPGPRILEPRGGSVR